MAHVPKNPNIAMRDGVSPSCVALPRVRHSPWLLLIDHLSERLPRISRAQSMDVLSSQSNLAGYRAVIEAALLAHEDAWDWDPDLVLSGSEVAEDRPDDWRLEVWLPRRPGKTEQGAIKALFAGRAPKLEIEQLPEVDWLTHSQQGLEPIRAGRFHVHTPEHSPLDQPGVRDFAIPASQAFGTGQHATTAGCLAMLGTMKAQGVVVRNLADIGTGTGLLAFAALHLWPRALATPLDPG